MLNRIIFLTLVAIISVNYLFFRVWVTLIFSIIIFFLCFFFKNQHLAISLVQLEILGLMAIFILCNEIFIIEKELLFLFVIIVVVVIEASLGLSLIVKQARNLNKEFLKFFF